jgi:hypothetical protein
MDHYVEGSTRAKIWYLSACAAVVLALVLVNIYFPYPKSIDSVSSIEATAQRHLVIALLFTIFLVPYTIRFVNLARLSVRQGQWPPSGIAMPFRTRVLSIARPAKVYILTTIVIAVPWLATVVEFYAWYTFSQMAQLAHAT